MSLKFAIYRLLDISKERNYSISIILNSNIISWSLTRNLTFGLFQNILDTQVNTQVFVKLMILSLKCVLRDWQTYIFI